jgi:hypothetical protein
MPMSDENRRRRSPIILFACICGYMAAAAAALNVLVYGASPWYWLVSVAMVVIPSIALRHT